MNLRLSMACIGILLLPARPGGAQSTATGSVVAVDHSVPFGTVPGKLLLLGNYLVFVDEQQPGASFVVAKSAIKETKLSNPYELEIKPFTEDSYKIHFDGSGMDPAAYRVLVDRVTLARTNR